MNRQKRNNYTLNGSFHTLEIKSQEVTPTKAQPVSNCITTRINQDGTIATSKINPNKLDGDIFTFSDFKKVFNTILEENGIKEYKEILRR